MKSIRYILILAALCIASSVRAQSNGPVAEYITSDIQALAQNLNNDPLRIYNYVHDHIRYVHYWGCKKGAELTLLEKSGNDFDQSALLVALLRSAGYTNAGYNYGVVTAPFLSTNGQPDLFHWLGLELPGITNYTSVSNQWQYIINDCLGNIFFFRGYPWGASYAKNQYQFQRVWVTLPMGSNTYDLDPSYKITAPVSGINLASAMGLDTNYLMTTAGGTVGSNYVQYLNEENVRGTLSGYTSNLLAYINSNCPNASVEQILGAGGIVPSAVTNLSGLATAFPSTNMYGTMPVISWTYIPTNMMYALKMDFGVTNHFWWLPQLMGQCISMSSSNGIATLRQETNVLSQFNVSAYGPYFNITMHDYYPQGGGDSVWNTNNNTYTPAYAAGPNGFVTFPQPYSTVNANYVFSYAFEPDWGWLQQRQQKLDTYRNQGLSDTNITVVMETLNVMGLNWLVQVQNIDRTLAQQIPVAPEHPIWMGRMSQEAGLGYYIDIYNAVTSPYSLTNMKATNVQQWIDQSLQFGSAMEHAIIEELQSSNLVGASTVKMLELSSAKSNKIFLANITNWSSISAQLTNYSSSSLSTIAPTNSYTHVLLSQNGGIPIAGTGSWTGYGVFKQDAMNQALIGSTNGIYGGGYVSDPLATVDPPFVSYFGDSQPQSFNPAPVSVPPVTAADPINMADGSFQEQVTDLSIGQKEPRGISFSRYYCSNRRTSNPAHMSPGWIHNYYLNAASISSPKASLGGTTAAQAAPMLVATAAAINLFNTTNLDPKNWMVTVLINKWGIDQIVSNAVSVSLGKDVLQFVKEPDGSFAPPANCTTTLVATNGGYQLQERHGRTFTFNTNGLGTSIVDQYGQALNITYSSSNYLNTVTDWKGNTLTFGYTGSPLRLASVQDNHSRTVSYGYWTNATTGQADLNSYQDAQGTEWGYWYDANHQLIEEYKPADSGPQQLVVSNVYNDFGQVSYQYTMGNTNSLWRICASGWNTLVIDPSGGTQEYIFDDKSRMVGTKDALTNLSQKFYDGQDHVVMTISPMNETNQATYDGNNNLVQSIDALGYTNTMVYDANNNLVYTIDARGNTNSFGYNSHFQLIVSTNAMGDTVANAYDSTYGYLTSRTDAGGTTTYGHDSYGYLNSITYPGNLGTNAYVNNPLGDVTNAVNAEGGVTSFQYNKRRQLTSTIMAGISTNSIVYDAAGEVESVTDARGNVTSNTWSATGKLLTTTLPATPQGSPVSSNVYDGRDWLFYTLNPLHQQTTYWFDAAQRLYAITDPLSRTPGFGYDNDGRRIESYNAAGNSYWQFWTARGQPSWAANEVGNYSSDYYDANGNLTTLLNWNDDPWQFYYDAANRQTNLYTPMGYSASKSYNHRGSVQTSTDGNGQTQTFVYDARGRMVTNHDSVFTDVYQYDFNNKLTAVIENGASNNWDYDAFGQLTGYIDTANNLIQYGYDANGNLTNLVYPGGRKVVYAYDNLNRLTNVMDWAGRHTSYTYDLASEVKQITRPNGTMRLLAYDAGGQTTNIVEYGPNPLTAITFFNLKWDAAGRMNSEFAAPLPHAYTPPSPTNLFDADDRLTNYNGQTIWNDGNANMTSGPLTNNTTLVSYSYDSRNRLTNVNGFVLGPPTLHYDYDPANHRTEITNVTTGAKTLFMTDPKSGQVLMRVIGTRTNYYVYGLGLVYEEDDTASSTNTLTYHYDYRGSTVALTDDGGNVTDRMEYSTYGMVSYRAGTNNTPFLYNGRFGVQTDPNGLMYMRARYYNPYICRFVNADPSGFGGGLNRFAYANGNPVSMSDPFGLGATSLDSGSSWMNQIAEGLGIDTSIGASMDRQNALASGANALTGGLLNDATIGINYLNSKFSQNVLGVDNGPVTDMFGNIATPAEQKAAFVQIGAMVGQAAAMGALSWAAGVGTEVSAAIAENSALDAEGVGTKLFGSSEYVIGDADTAMQTQGALLRNYAANAPNPGIDIVEGLTENAHIDTISGRINLSSDLVENYPHLIDGTVTEELFHFQQLQTRGLLGSSITAEQSQQMENEVVNLLLNSGFKKY